MGLLKPWLLNGGKIMAYKDKEQQRQALRIWQKNNRDKVNAYSRKWKKNNLEKIKNYDATVYKRESRCKHKSCIRIASPNHSRCYWHTRLDGWKANGIKIELTSAEDIEIWYTQLLKDQDGLCAIKTCSNKAIHLDHNHITGKIRGILCSNCNHALGKIKDNIFILSSLIDYLIINNSL